MKKKYKGIHLIRGEEVINHWNPVFWISLPQYSLALLFIIISGLNYYFNPYTFGEDSLIITTFTLASIGVLWWLVNYVYNKFNIVIVTSKRIIMKNGVLKTDIKEIDIDKIQNSKIEQSFIQRLLNYGTISLDTSGSTGYEAIIHGTKSVNEKYTLIKYAMEQELDAVEEKRERIKVERSLEKKKELLEKKKEEIKKLEEEIKRKE